MGTASAQQHPASLTLMLLVLLLQKQAMHAATMLFVCPVCRGKARFRAKMAKLGIQIPVRLVSFCPALRTLRRRCCACPGAALAGRVPCHPASVGLSFMEKLGMSSRWMSRDALDLPHAYGSGGSSHSPSSLADDHLGGLMKRTRRCEKGTGAVTSASAITEEAGRRQRNRGE